MSEEDDILNIEKRLPVLQAIQFKLNNLTSSLKDFPKGCADEEYLTGLVTTMFVAIMKASSANGVSPNVSKISEYLNERFGMEEGK